MSWTDRADEDRIKNLEAAAAAKEYERKVNQVIDAAINALPYDPSKELLELGKRTFGSEWARRPYTSTYTRQTPSEFRGGDPSRWQREYSAHHNTPKFTDKDKQYFQEYRLYAYGALDNAATPHSFTLWGWSGIVSTGSRSSGIERSDFYTLMYKLFKAGPKTSLIDRLSFGSPKPSPSTDRPFFPAPPPRIPFRPMGLHRGTHSDGGM